MLYITKRDGREVLFDKEKIITAINKAFIEVDGVLYENETAEDIAQEIKDIISLENKTLSVEDIQDLIEDKLMQSERRDVAKAYVRFRYKKEQARNYTNDFITLIREKLDGKKIQNQNANVDEASFGGRTGEASSVVTRRLAMDYLLSPKARQNHLQNRIYIHKLNCA